MKKILFVFITLFATIVACDDPNEGELFVTPPESEAEMSVIDVLESKPETYSRWIEFLKYANYYNACKNTDKATLFCPDNDAVDAFLAERGVSSVDQLDLEYAKNVVRVHIINQESVTDSTLSDNAKLGKAIDNSTLFSSNLVMSYGYTITDVDDDQRSDMVYDSEYMYINNQARVIKNSVVCNNGTFYTLGDVIRPLTENILEKLEQAGEYSIFSAAISADAEILAMATSGTSSDRVTCFAVPDEVFHGAGITDVNSLKQWLVSNGEYSNPEEALRNYMKYHFLKREYTTSEIFNVSEDGETLIYDTQLEGQAITADLSNSQKIVNKTIRILRSDIEARNGLINKVNDVMPVYHPDPVVVRWDFLNNSDIIAIVNKHGEINGNANLFTSELTSSETSIELYGDGIRPYYVYEDPNTQELDTINITSFTFQANESRASANTYKHIGFYKERYYSNSDKTARHYAYMNNYLNLNIGYAGWIQFTTPVIIAGKYKIVLHYLKDPNMRNYYASGSMTRFDLDEEKSIVYLYKGLVQGSGRELYNNVDITLFNNVTFEGSTSHTFKITMMDINAKTGSSYSQKLDYVEFIPID